MVAARVVLAVLSATHHLLALWALDFEDILCHLDAVVHLVERVGGSRCRDQTQEVVLVASSRAAYRAANTQVFLAQVYHEEGRGRLQRKLTGTALTVLKRAPV